MINLDFIKEVKKIGAKWDATEKKWIAPELAEKEFKAIEEKYFQDLVAVELTLEKNIWDADNSRWGYLMCIDVAGYIIASASGRDSGAKLGEGVAKISGSFTSSGSAKNYYCSNSTECVVRLKVSRNVLSQIENYEGVKISLLEEDKKDNSEQEEILKAIAILEKNGYKISK